MDATILLTADHNRVAGLFTRFKAAKDRDDLGEMTTLAATIGTELEVHTTIEEEIFYPALHDVNDEIHELISEGLEEHNVAKRLLAEIASEQPNNDDWAAKVSVLIEAIEHHKEEEESEMFPKVRAATSSEVLRRKRRRSPVARRCRKRSSPRRLRRGADIAHGHRGSRGSCSSSSPIVSVASARSSSRSWLPFCSSLCSNCCERDSKRDQRPGVGR